MPVRYYLVKGYKESNIEKVELTMQQFINMEKIAKFSGPGHYADPPYPATNGFSIPGLCCTVEFEE